MADTLGGLVRRGHGDEAIATSPRTLSVGHHLCTNNLSDEQTDEANNSTQHKEWKATEQIQATLPYLLKRAFRSVALVVEERPLTHRFLLLLAAAPLPVA